jgi:hypothetical protein
MPNSNSNINEVFSDQYQFENKRKIQNDIFLSWREKRKKKVFLNYKFEFEFDRHLSSEEKRKRKSFSEL